MAGNLKYCISLLQDNEESTRREARQVLLKLCDKIMQNPDDSRYRRVRLENAVISGKLLPASGAIECLFEAGFIESDDGFVLPRDASLAGVKELHSRLLDDSARAHRSARDSKRSPSSGPSTVAVEGRGVERPSGVECQRPPADNSFLVHLMDHFASVLRYEDEGLQAKARAMVPLERLQILALERLRRVQKEIKIKQIRDDIDLEDLLLAELLRWFKFEFFQWVDTLACQRCTGECYNDGSRASPDPRRISRIEIHRCKSCKYENEFPRYTDPEPLLASRRGRCGEWANCFTLVCRSVGMDARLVYDATDHVWTEVWSLAHGRWLHADACENALDRPLMYERGWGKRLSYVVAFSRDEVQDVTWRYTREPARAMARRRHCSEEALALFVRRSNEARQSAAAGYGPARRRFVLRRRALELAEMVAACAPGAPPRGAERDAGARTSGSLAWRLARGELGAAAVAPPPRGWPVPEGASVFRLLYDVVRDAYTALADGEVLATRPKWQEGVERLEGAVFRKEEPDWRMVYLARSPGFESGRVTWSLALGDGGGRRVRSVSLRASAHTFAGARVEWQVEGLMPTGATKIVAVADCRNLRTLELQGATKISVTASLSGGEGDVAWQHAQLFRASLDRCDDGESTEPSLLIEVTLARDQA